MKTLFCLLLLLEAAVFAGDPSAAIRPKLRTIATSCRFSRSAAELSSTRRSRSDGVLALMIKLAPGPRLSSRQCCSGRMPPWYADTPPGRFHNDPRLSRQDRQVGGLGRRGRAGWQSRKILRLWLLSPTVGYRQTDAIFDVPAPFQIPATGTLIHVCHGAHGIQGRSLDSSNDSAG